jgi:hypothetical protein
MQTIPPRRHVDRPRRAVHRLGPDEQHLRLDRMGTAPLDDEPGRGHTLRGHAAGRRERFGEPALKPLLGTNPQFATQRRACRKAVIHRATRRADRARHRGHRHRGRSVGREQRCGGVE